MMVKKFCKYFCIIGLMLIAFPELHAQANNNEAPTDLSDSKREEIQRYFGYEKLLFRYLSSPYDITMTVNERGNFLDIGFIYLMFLPILLLLYFERKRWLVISMMAFFLFMLIVSISNSFVYDAERITLIENKDGAFTTEPNISIGSDLFGFISTQIHKVNNVIYAPISKIFNPITGNQDYVSYPILLLLFIGLSWVILKSFPNERIQNRHKLAILLLGYSFLWFVLSAGIVWYGFLMFLLGLIFIPLLLNNIESEGSFTKIMKNSFYGFATIWIFMGFFNRLSNVQPTTPMEMQGMGVYNPHFFKYSQGLFDEGATVESLYPNLFLAVNHINKFENALIYRVGTSFSYFIDDNSNRVFMDNQLGFFNTLIKNYPERNMLNNVLKSSNFKFIIVDLYTETLDRTPERTLSKKFKMLMNYLYQNDKMRLIGTDRVIKNANNQDVLGVFGNITSNGSYAIFEILD